MCIEVESLTSFLFCLIMTKLERIDDNPCDVLVVNRGPPSNPCVFGGVFSWFPFFWWIRSGAEVAGDGGASGREERTNRGRWLFLAMEARN